MAIRAVISNTSPSPDAPLNEAWLGSFGVDGDDGVGLTTAAILSFLPQMDPGTWYRLVDFAKQVASTEWGSVGEDQWTSLEIKEDTVGGELSVSIDLKLVDAVQSLCSAAVEHLSAFENENIWIRFE